MCVAVVSLMDTTTANYIVILTASCDYYLAASVHHQLSVVMFIPVIIFSHFVSSGWPDCPHAGQ